MSRQFKIVNKLVRDNRIIGAVCKFSDNSIQCVRKERFNKLFMGARCLNAKLSSDLKIISSGDSIESLDMTDNKRILYHGSKTGIVGSPRHDKSRPICDFGVGFYTGTLAQQAQGILSSSPKGVFYILYCDTSNLSIYEFKDATTWALYVGVHRGYIDISQIPKFKPIFDSISRHDIIVGAIADDRMQEVFPEFMEGTITDKVLTECLKSVRLGDQWVFKTANACNQVRILAEQRLTSDQLLSVKQTQSKAMSDVREKVSSNKLLYRRSGKYVDEIMEEYR